MCLFNLTKLNKQKVGSARILELLHIATYVHDMAQWQIQNKTN